MDWLVIGLGGALGAMLRHGLNLLLMKRFGWEPWGTLVANVLGCLLIGIAWSVIEHDKLTSPRLKMFLLTGFLGGLTTFSTFGYQTCRLLQASGLPLALWNTALNLMLGFAAVGVGYIMTNQLFPPSVKPLATFQAEPSAPATTGEVPPPASIGPASIRDS